MPVSRKKSCRQCRVAKARCNLSFPCCSRCSERGLQCNFETAPPDHTPHLSHHQTQELRPDFGASSSSPPREHSRQTLADFIEATMDDGHAPGLEQGIEPLGSDRQDPGLVQVHDLAHDATFDWNAAERLFSGSSPMDLVDSSLGGPSIDLEQPIESTSSSRPGRLVDYLQVRSLSPEQAGNYHQTGLPFPRQNTISLEIEKGVAFIYSTVCSNLMAPKKPKSTQSFLMRQVIWGQIRNYPKMIIEGQLPPFIYPSCVLDDKLPRVCAVNGAHDCLPEPLAICSSLVRMFYSRTASTSAFIWKSIYKELDRLRSEVSHCPIPWST